MLISGSALHQEVLSVHSVRKYPRIYPLGIMNVCYQTLHQFMY